MSAIDWARMAAPQPDGYDSETALRLLREEPAGRPHGPFERPRTGSGRHLPGSAVAIRPMEGRYRGLAPRFAQARLDHPHLERAWALLHAWPAAAAQFARLMWCVYPLRFTQGEGDLRQGSASHSFEEDVGTMFCTVQEPIATAQALVHELAHTKLRACGVYFERALRLVRNDPQRRYRSPVVVTEPRPMTAVLHAQYSFIHITWLDVCLWRGAERWLRPDERPLLRRYLERNLRRMELGHGVLAEHLETDRDGAVFAQAFAQWSEQVMAGARAALAD